MSTENVNIDDCAVSTTLNKILNISLKCPIDFVDI